MMTIKMALAIGLGLLSFTARSEILEPQTLTPTLLGGPYDFEIDAGIYRTPTQLIKEGQYPTFDDDYDLRGMKLAIERQLHRFKSKSLTGKIVMGAKSYPLSKVRDSLVTFNNLIDEFSICLTRASRQACYDDLNKAIRSQFLVFAPKLTKKDPRYGDEKFAMFTGYNTFHMEGRLAPDGEYKYPVFARPSQPRLVKKTRVQIDFDGALSGLGLELVYVKSLFDIYIMHVQGSGRITVPQKDGSSQDFFLNYDGSNKQRWQFISLYMAKKGYIVNGSIPSQRRYMRENPDKHREIFSQCPSYIYFKPTLDWPKGSDLVPVTPGRTIAQDTATYPFKGLIAFVESQRPVEQLQYNLEEENKSNVQFRPFSRFFIDQDTGGAINGKARGDLYFGSDDYAMFASMFQAELGKIHYLLLK